MKSLFVVWALIASYTVVYAQSCCCTGAGANYSVLPNLDKHIMGLRYTHRSYFSETHSLNPEQNGKITNQYINSLELFGRFNLNKRFQLSVFMPVNFIRQKSGNETSQVNGLGDMSFLLQYQLINPRACTGKKTRHQLRIGAGTKLPSGDFTMNVNDLFNTNLQLGTGSIDFIANAVYVFRFKNFGFNAIASYNLNTANNKAYRFGDKIQAGAAFFYLLKVKEFQIMPTLAFNYQRQFENRYKLRLLDYTGGDFIAGSVGIDIYYKQFAFSSSVSPALMNGVNWQGENKNKLNIEAGLFYNFSTTKK